MCTPSSSNPQGNRKLPVGRYLLALLLALLLFIGLAMLQQQEAFLPLFGFGRDEAMKTGHDPKAMAGEKHAQTLVARFNGALQVAYQSGSTSALPASDALKLQLARALKFSRERREPAPSLKKQRIIRTTSIPPASWTVITEELWVWAGAPGLPPAQSRLRFQYTLAPTPTGLRIEEMKPVLPEPRRANAR